MYKRQFQYPVGSATKGKLAAALRSLGFDRVFDTVFSADLTIMEEAAELVERIKNGGKMPMFTSCCPGWINFAEENCADMLDNISSCKSPQQMFGAMVKTYLAEKEGIPAEKIVVVSAMPCTADVYKRQVVQVAPSVRASIGEVFGYPIGSETKGKLAAAMRALGFDRVFDTVLGADLTIMEEATELIGRMKKDCNMPMFTSCCPGWISYCENNHKELLDQLSSCKSPQQMFGAMVKTYLAEKEGIAKDRIVVVSVMLVCLLYTSRCV